MGVQCKWTLNEGPPKSLPMPLFTAEGASA